MKNKTISVLNRFEDILLVAMFVSMVAIIFVQVIMRYAFNNSLSWSEELGKFLFVWLSWIGISIGARRREHIKITMLVDKLPYRAARAMDVLVELTLIAICAITAYYGVTLVFSQAGTHFAGIKISMSWGYLSVVVGCILMVIRSLVTLTEAIIAVKRGEPEVELGEGGNN